MIPITVCVEQDGHVEQQEILLIIPINQHASVDQQAYAYNVTYEKTSFYMFYYSGSSTDQNG